ncbi:acyl--CoA ligase family protein [Ornithinicoccus hortensis]|uniref:Fatty-acyl-CoA synthase n=1 Tax=Ornithinicoccus hortensis TaxID=82346 RepID=A0A542YVH0_9MICO|nr:acyl--CoA ligase family protein [Ornithinicoccus hortensis]TQL52077.1 fatty-acyl-CoA synthase [Ornithinicoccus hortensis]
MNAVTAQPDPSNTPLTPLSFLGRSADVWADKVAVVDDGRQLTYAEFAEQAQAVARALEAAGVAPGDRVAYLMPNVTEQLVAHFAVPLAGGVLVAINTRLAAPEIGYILEHSGAKVLVVDGRLEQLAGRALADTPGDITLVVANRKGDPVAGATTYEDFLAAGTDTVFPWEVEDELAPISINYTSGTTGRPKGVVYTHRGAYLNALGELLHSRHSPESVYLWTLPMFHCNGWCTPWAITAYGARHVCLPEVRGDRIWELIRQEGVTHLNAAPTVLTAIMAADSAGELPQPVTVTTAGAPPSPTTIGQMEDLGFTLIHVYGLTETYGPYSVCEVQEPWLSLGPDERARLKARQGVGMLQAERLRVVDQDMVDVPADGATMGEIVMRGNNVMAGYFRDPEGTQEAFRGGWFHSGDLGVMHPDGYVELRDRAKDVVISGGENISTVEVEQALMSHPAVSEAAVVGVPDPDWGERPKGFVTVRQGATTTGEELIAHVRSRIAHYKAPREVELVHELPKTSTGKIQKFVLREAEWDSKESRIQG